MYVIPDFSSALFRLRTRYGYADDVSNAGDHSVKCFEARQEPISLILTSLTVLSIKDKRARVIK